MDFTRKRELEGNIAEARTMSREAEKEVEALSQQLETAETSIKKLKEEKKQIEERRDAVHSAKRKLRAMMLRLGEFIISLTRSQAFDYFTI